MVCSPHYLASQAGLEVLKSGGNAVDACVTVNAVLQVVYPPMCHLGGDAFFMVWLAREQRLLGLNGSGRSAAAASSAELRRAGHDSMPQFGAYTITTPGCVDAWVEVLRRCGTRSLAETLAPAERLAREGFEVSPKLAGWIELFGDTPLADDGWRRIFSPGGARPKAGDRFLQEKLAATYRALMDGGREVLYEGELGDRLARRVQELGGWLTAEDLRAHRSEWVEPVRSVYRGVEICEMPPNSQGTTAQLILNLLQGQGELPDDDAARTDLMLRASAAAYEERDRQLADPVRMDAPPDVLALPETAARLWPRLQAPAEPVALDGDTCYFCAVDTEGNCCSAIQSLYRGFVAGVDPETGVLFQSRGAFFTLQPGHRNELVPGVRTLHTLMPAMALRDAEPWLVFGTMGGNAQAQIHVQLVTDVVDRGMSVADAVSAPRWLWGESVLSEEAHDVSLELGMASLEAPLRDRGWKVAVLDAGDPFGHAHMIELRDGALVGAADPRAESLAAGF
jgi:gamma-glutamyltranspeptidase/glutathione hydrolase